MVSSFPKMQKSSASFSQSIRNRLRLKNLQAQAKNFCRVLDIRVTEIMEAHILQAQRFHDLLEGQIDRLIAQVAAQLCREDQIIRVVPRLARQLRPALLPGFLLFQRVHYSASRHN